MSLKLFFTQTEFEVHLWGREGSDWAETMRDQMIQAGNPRYGMTDNPEQADIIVFWEPDQRSQAVWIPRLRAHPLVQQFPNKVFVVSVEDFPLGLLSGLYTSLPAWRHHPHRHRTTLYYRTPNQFLRSPRATRQVSPTHLAAFVGGVSHEIRHCLFQMARDFAEHDIILTPTPSDHFLMPKDLGHKPFTSPSSKQSSTQNSVSAQEATDRRVIAYKNRWRWEEPR